VSTHKEEQHESPPQRCKIVTYIHTYIQIQTGWRTDLRTTDLLDGVDAVAKSSPLLLVAGDNGGI